MITGEIFRDWWQTVAAIASGIAAVLPFCLSRKKDRRKNARARRAAVSILLGILAASFVFWQVSARESAKSQHANSPAKPEQQIIISGSNSGGVQQISGSVGGSVLGSGSTQNISNTTNRQVDDHRSKSPTLNHSPINTGGGDVTFGDKISGDGSGNNISNANGKVIINGSDNSQSYTGANSGILIQGNSNTTIIHVWMNTTDFKFPSDGKFQFPDVPSQKMAELKRLSQTEEFKLAMRPFVALGTFQPVEKVIRMRPDNAGSNRRPFSYGKLYAIGALQSDIKGQENLVKLAISEDDKERPRWPMPKYAARAWVQNPEYTSLVHNAQKFINIYHDEMVQLGMLSE